MLNIDSLQNGIVIDHIKAGASMTIYDLLELGKLDCCVAIIKNARSAKYGKKDIIKIDGDIDVNLDILGFLDPNITVGIIRDGKLVEKKKLVLPKKLKNVIKCRNPRCITSIEEGIDHIFVLGENQRYRCAYCEQEYRPKSGKHR
ncbi:MAG TPA: aspartate carbamoyltransferase regulatory subunit [Candidatus Caccousia avicola]|uniref:Aspartate carbamoyltransferase regulatory subunit n=1 Tax=Candidatus Caccousia avicola TaxID=2840721 RepID=A0A9D1APF3_9FIRM|nr:aspartate carbamoyltransferase regulatory subunit [Candidatus Caccousia avicola]